MEGAIWLAVCFAAAWAIWHVFFEEDFRSMVVTADTEGWVGLVQPSPSGGAEQNYGRFPVTDYGTAPGLSAQSRLAGIGPAIPSFQAPSVPSVQPNLQLKP